jgi:UDP:flavonoid glycosyltransferase YjiC (YdhE family)
VLERFLERHETVVLVSFGSQSRTYARLLRQIVALSDPPYPLVVQTHGVRTGATPGAAGGSGRTLILDGSEGEVEHRAVLNRCRAVVHHGGAGTLHAATGAGVPSVIVPAAADTFFWAAAAEQAGVAPPAVSLSAATGRGVAADTKRASAEPYRAHAAARARRMQGENGPSRAAQVLYSHLTE